MSKGKWVVSEDGRVALASFTTKRAAHAEAKARRAAGSAAFVYDEKTFASLIVVSAESAQRLAELAGVPRNWVYLVVKPGHDLHDEHTVVRAVTADERDEAARVRAEGWRCELRLVGERVNGKLVWAVPMSERPEWARRVPCTSCSDASCMLCDDNGEVPAAEVA